MTTGDLKKYISVLLALLLLLGTLPGCGKDEPTPQIPRETAVEQVTDDRTLAQKTVNAFAQYSGISADAYPESMRTLMEMNPEAVGFVLGYPHLKDKTFQVDLSSYANSETVPLFMQWDIRWGYIPYGSDVAAITACGPLCLSMVAYYLTGNNNMSPDKIIQFAKDEGYCVKGSGTAWTLISKGAKKLGLNVKELPLSEGTMRRELEKGNPVICVMGPGVFTTTGHFIVVTGYEDGKFRVNDPNSLDRSNRLWSYSEFQDQIRNLWALSAPTPVEGDVSVEFE